ncbi:MAG: endonuclease/exonuclease/phosphatase family protein [Devosia nanyangense]|uniref:Endonuclease/exonuclease/phosphatase family protein n=1 Tax=Devosia nanyangense TaxID=1228055 RepID=A0A933KXC3_9HYPH|nr:endonuclease/exonuclease/phosphatase family protein [Devosia nanyangense]
MQLKIASYNIRKAVGLDWRRRPARVLEVLNEIGADVVALQEVDRRFGSRTTALDPEMIARETDYQAINFSHRPQSLGFHGNVILARKSIRVADARPMVLPHLEPRGAAVADLEHDGRLVRIVGMHLGLTRKWRQLQTETIVAELRALEANLPTILMGDLNEPDLKSGVLRAFEQRHTIAECGPSFHASMPVFSLDRIIVTEDIVIGETGVHRSALAREASDHLPIWARVTLPVHHS